MSTSLSRADWAKALVVVVVWGLNFVVMKWGLATLSPLVLCALRFLAASLPFLLFVRPPRHLSWGVMAAYGLVQGVGQFGLLFTGMQLGMPAGMSSVVLQTQAFITMLMAAALLGETPHRWQWLGLCIAIGGLVFIGAAHGDGASGMTLAGFLLTVGAAAMWAGSNLLTRVAARQGPYEPVSFIVWSSVFPIVPLLLLACVVDGTEAVVQQLRGLGGRELGVVAYLALLSTLLGYGLWTRLLQRYAASTVA
ncbi:MAG: EamA family transporter, partial [Diaphorobacter nitroreducens]